MHSAQLLLYLFGFPEKMGIMPTNPQGPKPQCMLGWGSPWCTAICPLVYKHICTITPKNIAKMYACIHSPAKPAWRNAIMYVVPNYVQSVHIHIHKQTPDTTHSPYGMVYDIQAWWDTYSDFHTCMIKFRCLCSHIYTNVSLLVSYSVMNGNKTKTVP